MVNLWPVAQKALLDPAAGLAAEAAEQADHAADRPRTEAFFARALVRDLAVIGLCSLEDSGYPRWKAQPADFTSRDAGPADVAAALRRLVSTAYVLSKKPLRVHCSLLPDPDALRAAGILPDEPKESITSLRLESSLWGNEDLDVSVPMPPMERRRPDATVPADAVLRRFGWQHYASAAQRDAVRSILSAPERAVILVVIPTGGGKSLCAQLPAFHWTRAGWTTGAMTVVITPTVALALDQVRAAKSRFCGGAERVVALLGGTSELRKAELLRDIADGAPSLVFMSPEMALGTQGRAALIAAARAGRLASFVVDEAHLISTWGVKFRPDLQRLARFRHELAAISPTMVSVLLSATVTPEGRRRLRDLYATPADNFMEINGSELRPEHDFSIVDARSPDERDQLAVDLVRRLPRPLLLYTTKVDQAEQFSRRLHDLGFWRQRAFTGETPQREREEVIDAWRADQLDFVVATSAFGLGIDKPDVRAVVHVTLPESLDRFYQEVGRSGRDGFSATSVVIRCAGDESLAVDLLMSNLLKSDTAAKRWVSMWRSSRPEPDWTPDPRMTIRQVDLDDRAEHVQRQAEASGRRNAEWNAAAILLLERARLVAVHKMDTLVDDQCHRWWTIATSEADLFDHEQLLAQRVEDTRAREQQENQEALRRLAEALDPRSSVCLLAQLAEVYGLVTGSSCGRCPHCRSRGLPSMPSPARSPLGPAWSTAPRRSRTLHHKVQAVLDRGFSQVVLVGPRAALARGLKDAGISRTLSGLAEGGVEQFICSEAEREHLLEVLGGGPKEALGITVTLQDLLRQPLVRLFPLPTAVVLTGSATLPDLQHAIGRVLELSRSSGAPFTFVIPEGMMDPVRPDRALAERIDAPRLRADALFAF